MVSDVFDLDDVDRGILYLLQQNARSVTIETMAEEVGVAESTVRYRIKQMEEAGVIRGYHPEIDYAQAGYELHVRWICSAPTDEREAIAGDALGVEGVVATSELLDGPQNVHVEAVATGPDHMAEMHDELEALGLKIQESLLFRRKHIQPFDQFGQETVDG